MSKTRHGLHSPFIYRLVDEVIYDHRAKPVYAGVERTQLPPTARRRLKLARLIYRLVADIDPGSVIVLGDGSADVVPAYLQKATPLVQIHHLGSSQGPDMENFKAIDVAYFANGLDGAAIFNYFKWCLPRVHENSMLVFTELYRTEDIKKAWAQVKADPKVTATVDMFWIGLVFLNRVRLKKILGYVFDR